MGIQIGLGQNPLADPLGPHVGVYIAALLCHHHLADELRRTGAESQTHARAEHLAEGPGIHHRAGGVEVLDGRHRFARDAQRAVGVILQHRHAVAHRQLVDGLALCQAGGVAGGVLEVGDAVEELGLLIPEDLFQSLQIHAVRLQRHTGQPRAEAAHGIVGAQKGGLLHRDHIALVAEQLCHELDDLLAAAGDNEIIRITHHRPLTVGVVPGGLRRGP